VVPREAEEEALRLAAEKATKESASRKAIMEGRTLRDVYDTYGVL
jgi:regulator of RNase E activity RraA